MRSCIISENSHYRNVLFYTHATFTLGDFMWSNFITLEPNEAWRKSHFGLWKHFFQSLLMGLQKCNQQSWRNFSSTSSSQFWTKVEWVKQGGANFSTSGFWRIFAFLSPHTNEVVFGNFLIHYGIDIVGTIIYVKMWTK